MNFSISTIVFVLTVAIIGYGVYEIVRFSTLVKKGKELAAHAQSFSRDTGSPRTILVIGDSTAVGVGSSSEHSVAGRLAQTFPVDIENKAVSGAKLDDVLKQIEQAAHEQYELVLIHAGANDVIQRTPVHLIEEHTQRLMERARTKSERVALLTAGDIGEAPIWPTPLSWYYSHQTAEVRNIIKTEVESQGALYIDIYSQNMNFEESPEKYYAPDYLHLSGEGYNKWFAFIMRELQRTWPSVYGQG